MARGASLRSWAWLLCSLNLALVAVQVILSRLDGEGSARNSADPLYSVPSSVGTAVVGALIAARMPRNPYGWVVSGCVLAFGLSGTFSEVRRVVGPASGIAALAEDYTFMVAFVLLSLVFLLFPTGRLPGPGWRWLPRTLTALAGVLAVVVLFAPSGGDPSRAGPWAVHGAAGQRWDDVAYGGRTAMFLLALFAMLSVVTRFRSAGPVERLQLKWFAFAGLVNAGTVAAGILGASSTVPTWAWKLVEEAGFTLIPVAVGLAVLRYRLYDIDRIISRTLAYGLLTAGLLGCYLLAVTVLHRLLTPLTGTDDLAVAASTLVVAAAFQPARRRVQAIVDRRFDRSRYDAARTVEAYAARLRTQVHLEDVVAGLRDTVATTVAPISVGLWLRDAPKSGGAR